MLDRREFYQVLLEQIDRNTAFCIREGDGPPGAPLTGGILFSPQRPERPGCHIRWLSVARKWRRRGVGRRLVEHVCDLVQPPATLSVITFDETNEEGRPARRFYERMGFHPAERAPDGPEGGARQVYRREFP
jgi:GNAT superfamily N-acetyltransferase